VNELREDSQPRENVPEAAREQPRPAETAPQDRPRAETTTRQEYADHMQQFPAANLHGEYPAHGIGGQDESVDAPWRLGERSQGMTREEYADHMRQLTAVGSDDQEDAGSFQPRDYTIQDEPAQQADIGALDTRDAPHASIREPSGHAGQDVSAADRQEHVILPVDVEQEQSATDGEGPPPDRSDGSDDVSPEQAQIAELRAQLAQAQAERDQARSERDQANSERDQAVSERDQAKSQFDQAVSQLDQAKDQLDQREAELTQTNGELTQIKAQLSQTRGELDETKRKLDQANQKIADLNPEGQEQTVMVEGDEQPLVDTGEPDAGPDSPDVLGGLDAKSPTIADRQSSEESADSRDTVLREHTLLRRVVTSDHVAVVPMLIDAYDTAAKFAAHNMLDGLTPLAGTLSGALALGLSALEKRRKEKENA
jgi:hypothetical protein